MDGFFRLALICLFFSSTAFGFSPDWSEGALISKEGRANIYKLPEAEQSELVKRGYIHALKYPVTVTGALLPFQPMKNFVEADDSNPIRRLIQRMGRGSFGIKSMEDFYKWVGLNPFPEEGDLGSAQIPYPDDFKPDYYMGVSIHDLPSKGKVITFSCATCHSANLFGKSIMGLTNKRSKANDLFIAAQKGLPLVGKRIFKFSTKATDRETKTYMETRENIRSIGAVAPQALGLDTSLAQVALSLAKRGKDPYATMDKKYYKNPRPNGLEKLVADSKPAVWWNVKYKNRWLSDGSIVSGNPIFTNFLWNELGRGTDMRELEKWMQDNPKVIQELTAAVFSTKPPRYEDFFDVENIDIEKAKRGEKIFKRTCKRCHGAYQKGWSLPNESELSFAEKIATTKVTYFSKTPIKDVGTDPGRHQGMKHFSDDLNRLAISKWMKTVVKPQKGYVPPPLEGIWARYPYLHNNSVPNLCALMTPPSKRPKTFYQGPAENKETDYDQECVGYPVGADIPKEWLKDKEAKYDTNKPGLSNAGHYEKIFLDRDGNEKFDANEKSDLRMFLKTL